MKAKIVGHTPGPWSIEDEDHIEHPSQIWIIDGRGLCVADVDIYEEAVIGPAEAEYNAHLISAAPEMLSGLILAVAHLIANGPRSAQLVIDLKGLIERAEGVNL